MGMEGSVASPLLGAAQEQHLSQESEACLALLSREQVLELSPVEIDSFTGVTDVHGDLAQELLVHLVSALRAAHPVKGLEALPLCPAFSLLLFCDAGKPFLAEPRHERPVLFGEVRVLVGDGGVFIFRAHLSSRGEPCAHPRHRLSSCPCCLSGEFTVFMTLLTRFSFVERISAIGHLCSSFSVGPLVLLSVVVEQEGVPAGG